MFSKADRGVIFAFDKESGFLPDSELRLCVACLGTQGSEPLCLNAKQLRGGEEMELMGDVYLV